MSFLRGAGARHLEGYKGLTEQKDVIRYEATQSVYIPLYATHTKEFDVLVKSGDTVKIGTKIAISSGPFEVVIFSSVAGQVVGVEDRLYDGETMCKHIHIQADGTKEQENALPSIDSKTASREELVSFMKAMGLVGCGGASFPTYVKYQGVKNIDTILINAVECEPFITADYKMIEGAMEHLLFGAQMMCQCAGANEIVIAIKKKHKNMILQMNEAIKSIKNIRVVEVKDVYPMGWERTLVETVMKKRYEKLPAEIGVIVNNVTTAIKFSEGLQIGTPIVRKTLTFSGDGLKNPVNVEAPIGLPVSEVITMLGGYSSKEVRVLRGGPMMGHSAASDDIVIDRATNAITVLRNKEYHTIPCLRCGSCSAHCPADLQPVRIAQALKADNIERIQQLEATSCIECGLCTFVCPSRIEVSNNVRKAKQKIFALNRK